MPLLSCLYDIVCQLRTFLSGEPGEVIFQMSNSMFKKMTSTRPPQTPNNPICCILAQYRKLHDTAALKIVRMATWEISRAPSSVPSKLVANGAKGCKQHSSFEQEHISMWFWNAGRYQAVHLLCASEHQQHYRAACVQHLHSLVNKAPYLHCSSLPAHLGRVKQQMLSIKGGTHLKHAPRCNRRWMHC